jgi:hypothetical protein
MKSGKVLKLVPGSAPPRPLGDHGMALWIAINEENVFNDAAGREALCSLCQALDRAEMLAEQIAQDGPVIQTRNGVKEHPAVRGELANRSFVVRTLHKLGLGLEPLKTVGRPPAKSWPLND